MSNQDTVELTPIEEMFIGDCSHEITRMGYSVEVWNTGFWSRRCHVLIHLHRDVVRKFTARTQTEAYRHAVRFARAYLKEQSEDSRRDHWLSLEVWA